MPAMEVQIIRAWRQSKDRDTRIHYIVLTSNGERRLYTDKGSGLYELLAAELDSKGYVGPRERVTLGTH